MNRPSQARLRDLWRHRRLVLQLIRRDVEARYRGTALGLVWSLLHPLVLLGIYTFVFGMVFRARWSDPGQGSLGQFALVLFCGLIVLNLFAECVGRAPGLIVASPSYVKKVVFPLEVLPVVVLGAALFNAVISLLMLVAARLLVDGLLPATLPLAPLVLLPLVLMALGTSWALASLGVFLRDLGQLVGLLLQVLMFLTPVFYPLEAVPARVRTLIALNPLAPIVEDFRRVVLWGRMPDWRGWALSLLVGGGIMIAGHAWFTRTKQAFADVL